MLLQAQSCIIALHGAARGGRAVFQRGVRVNSKISVALTCHVNLRDERERQYMCHMIACVSSK